MPKTPTSRSYRLSLPSPSGLPPNSTFYRRPIPPTPSPPSRSAAVGILQEFARSPSSIAVKQELEDTVLLAPTRRSVSMVVAGAREEGDDMEIKRESTLPLAGGVGGLQGELEDVDPFTVTVEARSPVSPPMGAPPQQYSEVVAIAAADRTTAVVVPAVPQRGSRMRRALLQIRQGPIPNPSAGASKALRIQFNARAKAIAARRRLHRAQAEISELEAHVGRLQRSEKQLKDRIYEGKEIIKDARGEVDESRADLIRAEERIDEMAASIVDLRRDFNLYRGWWLTENRSLKVVLREVPKRKWDAGLQAIASSSHGRFMSYSSSGSN